MSLFGSRPNTTSEAAHRACGTADRHAKVSPGKDGDAAVTAWGALCWPAARTLETVAAMNFPRFIAVLVLMLAFAGVLTLMFVFLH